MQSDCDNCVYYDREDPVEVFRREHASDPGMTPEKMLEETLKIVMAEDKRQEALRAQIARKRDFFYKMKMLREYGGLPDKIFLNPPDPNYKPMFPKPLK